MSALRRRPPGDLPVPVAGVDEAGRGPLAGPVVAAAVILPEKTVIEGIDDSKKLSADRREVLAVHIRRRAIAWAVGRADTAEIDELNILNATLLAMRRAIAALATLPAAVLVDGNRLPDLRFGEIVIDGDTIVGGDARIPSISAASILAKVARDQMMIEADALYPGYGFARHKGYGTALHLDSIERLGPCPIHRRSFRPFRGAD